MVTLFDVYKELKESKKNKVEKCQSPPFSYATSHIYVCI